MDDRDLLQRIILDPAVLTGKPVIRGTRLSVEYILNQLAHGSTFAALIDENPGLTDEDIKACLLFAGRSLGSTDFMPLTLEAA